MVAAQQPTCELLDYEDAAAILGVSVRTARRLVAQRVLRAVRIGHRTVKFRRADLSRAISRLAGEEVSEW